MGTHLGQYGELLRVVPELHALCANLLHHRCWRVLDLLVSRNSFTIHTTSPFSACSTRTGVRHILRKALTHKNSGCYRGDYGSPRAWDETVCRSCVSELVRMVGQQKRQDTSDVCSAHRVGGEEFSSGRVEQAAVSTRRHIQFD